MHICRCIGVKVGASPVGMSREVSIQIEISSPNFCQFLARFIVDKVRCKTFGYNQNGPKIKIFDEGHLTFGPLKICV